MADITLQTTGETRVTCVPNRFIDEYMKDANGEFVKVYLYLLRCLSAGIDVSIPEIADRLESTSSDIIRALNYWANRHLLSMTKDGDTILTISLTDPSLIPPRASAQSAAVAAPYARIPAYMSYSSDLAALMPVIPLTAAQAAALSVDRRAELPSRAASRFCSRMQMRHPKRKIRISVSFYLLRSAISVIRFLPEICRRFPTGIMSCPCPPT